MQRRSHSHNTATDAVDDQSKNKKKWANPKKVGFIFSNVCGAKNSPEMCYSLSEKDEVEEERDGQVFKKGEKDGVDGNDIEGFNEVDEKDGALSRTQVSLKDILENEDELLKQGRLDDDGKNSNRSVLEAKQYLKMLLSFPSFFNKKTGLKFIKSKSNKTSRCDSSGSDSSENGVATNCIVNGTEENSCSLATVSSSRISFSRVKLRRENSIRKKATNQVEEEEERGEEELCKKRILMGERCRPLNMSGILQYDKNGIILPEEVLP
ncbi:hypothetical protein L1049_020251 [Liquidambar formosana]|uniref:Uncharacterized protein n=1 Tax=Liquidambar formosana TaxID=63359 RepID=A0AAP0S879_LIQFO